MEPKKSELPSLGSTSYADVAALAEQLAEVMKSMVGCRFYPTDKELVLFYLKRKICGLIQKPEGVIDIYKHDPEDSPAPSILQNGDREWFFYSFIGRKHPNSHRLNRASEHGQWKITENDRVLTLNCRNVSIKKTLVYYRCKAGHTDWLMHEFSLHEDKLKRCKNIQDHYVLCKLIQKKEPSSMIEEQHGAPIVEEDSKNDDNIVDFDVNSFGDGEGTPMHMLLGDDPSFDLADVHELLSILHASVPAPSPLSIPELHVDAYFIIPQVVRDHPQHAEVEVLPEPEHEPEPPINPLPNRNGNGGQQQEAPQANHPLADIHIEDFQLEWGDFLELDDLLVPLPPPPNVEAPLQNVGVEMVENNVLLMIDPMLIPRMAFVPEDAHNYDHEDEDGEDGEVDDNDDVWPEQDVISHSYENFPTSDTESENSVLQPNQEAEVQAHGVGENNVLDPADNGHVSHLTNDFAPTNNEDGGASSSSSRVD